MTYEELLAETHDHISPEFIQLMREALKYQPPCICGNRGYTNLVNDVHFEGCPNHQSTTR